MKTIRCVLILLLLLQACNPMANPRLPETWIPENGSLVCLFFFIPDCPASQANFGAIMDLHAEYAPKGVTFKSICSDPLPDSAFLAQTLAEYQFTLPIEMDASLETAQLFQATTTPQVLLFGADGHLIYTGQVNDYYYAFGKHQNRPKQHYLANAIEAALQGKSPTISHTEPIGCRINFDWEKKAER